MGVFQNLLLIALVGFVRAKFLLPVEKCVLSDPKCLQKSIQDALPVFLAGIPEVGTESLDPLKMEDVDFELSGLKFKLTEATLNGLKNAVIDKVNWDTSKNKVEIMYHGDCALKGHYTADGRVLILPISGDGVMKLRMKNLSVRLFIDYTVKKDSDGKDFFALTKYNFDFEIKEAAHAELSNLFNGNKELSDVMHKFLNDNWKELSAEFGTPVMNAAAKTLFKNVGKYLKKMPIEDITILDP